MYIYTSLSSLFSSSPKKYNQRVSFDAEIFNRLHQQPDTAVHHAHHCSVLMESTIEGSSVPHLVTRLHTIPRFRVITRWQKAISVIIFVHVCEFGNGFPRTVRRVKPNLLQEWFFLGNTIFHHRDSMLRLAVR
jgi:hypothetical protein